MFKGTKNTNYIYFSSKPRRHLTKSLKSGGYRQNNHAKYPFQKSNQHCTHIEGPLEA